MKHLNAKLLTALLAKAGNHLTGDWLLVGGTLLPAVGLDVRTTVDIDLIGLGKEEAKQTLELMKLAESFGLSVETINQAAAFFLNKVGYAKADLLVLKKGKKATIFRPSLELYWKLKVPRLSESDVVDCQHYYHYCLSRGDAIRLSRLQSIIEKEAKGQVSPERRDRLKVLKELSNLNPNSNS